MNYPDPEHNPLCQCKGNPMKAFWCLTGHMLECHYPYSCRDAVCDHLHKYDVPMREVEQLEILARRAIEAGLRAPYQLADENNVIVKGDQP